MWNEGKKDGLYVAIGAGIVILIQALIAVLLAKYVFDHPYVKKILLRAGLVIFSILGIYFFLFRPRKINVSNTRKHLVTRTVFSKEC